MRKRTTPQQPPIYLSSARQVDLQVIGIPPERCAPLPTPETVAQYANRDVVVLPAVEGETAARIAVAALRTVKARVIVSPVSYRWLELSTYSFEQVEMVTQGLPLGEKDNARGHLIMDVGALYRHPCKPQKRLLGPIHEQDVGFLAAWRGTGKTLFSLSVAVALSSGKDFLDWKGSGEPVPVLYVDGEMPFPLLREHLNVVFNTFKQDGKSIFGDFDPAMLRLITPDVQPDGVIPSLRTDVGRRRIEDAIGSAKYVVLDNLSCLVGGNAENDPEEWEPIRSFQLGMRRAGVASCLIHHVGKGGDQRGHSSKEDILDWSMRLERPSDHDPSSGARFTLKYMKLRRGLNDVYPLDCELRRYGNNGNVEWSYRPLGQAIEETVVKLSQEGHAIREIVSILREDHGIRKSKNTIAKMIGR